MLCFCGIIPSFFWKLNFLVPFEDQLDVDASSDYSLNISEMAIPVSAGILSALRRIIARRVSLKV